MYSVFVLVKILKSFPIILWNIINKLAADSFAENVNTLGVKFSADLGILILCFLIAAAEQSNALLLCGIVEQVHNDLVFKDASEYGRINHFALWQVLLGNEIRSHQFIFVHLISEQLIIDGLAERIPFHNTAIIALAENNPFCPTIPASLSSIPK